MRPPEDGHARVQTAIEKIGDVGRYVKQERKEARQAAEKLQWYLREGKEPPGWLKDLLRENADDEHFATAFGNRLGHRGVLRIPAALGDIRMNEGDLKDLMSSVGELVGTATNGEGTDVPRRFKEALVKAAGSTETITVGDPGPRTSEGYEFREFWAVQKLLQFGEGHFEGDFLADVAGEIYENRDDLPGGWHNSGDYGLQGGEWGSGLGYAEDPMITALEALDDSPEAGREFFTVDPNGGELDRVRELMNDYYFDSNGGPALSEALKAASTEFPSVDPQRDTPAHRDAAEIASNFLHYAAEEERGFDWGNSAPVEVKRDIASTMAFYYEDLHRALTGGEAGGEVEIGAYKWEGESVFGFKYGANLQLDDAKTLVDTIWEDETSKERVLGAATVYANQTIEHQMDNWKDYLPDNVGDEISDEEEAAAKAKARAAGYKAYGAELGRLMGAAHEGEIERAETLATAKEFGKVLVGVGVAATGPLGVGASTGAAALGAIAGGAVDQVDGGPDSAREAYANEVDNATAASRATVAEMMLRRGDWSPGELSAEGKRYWDEENQQLKPPQDPEQYRDFKNWLLYETGPINQAHSDFFVGLQRGVAVYGSP